PSGVGRRAGGTRLAASRSADNARNKESHDRLVRLLLLRRGAGPRTGTARIGPVGGQASPSGGRPARSARGVGPPGVDLDGCERGAAGRPPLRGWGRSPRRFRPGSGAGGPARPALVHLGGPGVALEPVQHPPEGFLVVPARGAEIPNQAFQGPL